MDFLIVITWIVLGSLAAYFAQQRGRNPITWFILGLIFGILGLLALFIMPSLAENSKTSEASQASAVEIPQSTLAPPVLSNATAEWYYVDSNYTQQGPLSAADIKSLIEAQTITKETLVWCDGMPEWKKLEEVKDVITG